MKSLHRRRQGIAALLAAILISANLVSLRIALPAVAASCPTMQVVGVRGSGETQADSGGYGRTVRSVVDRIQQLVPATASHEIDYPAISDRVPSPRTQVSTFDATLSPKWINICCEVLRCLQ
jgi:hypothetical protein